MFQNILKNRNILTLLLSCVVILILLLFSSLFHILNKNIQNNYYSLKNFIFSEISNNNIVIATIDKKTLERLGRFPFSRDTYKNFIENTQSAGAAVIAFDIIFADSSKEDQDLIFEKSLKEAKIPIIFGSSITSDNDIEPPLPRFQKQLFATGFLPPNVNIGNRTVYSFSPFLTFEGVSYEHFSLAVLRGFYSYLYDEDFRTQDFKFKNPENYSFIDGGGIPLSSKNTNNILIHFLPSVAFEQISFIDLQEKRESEKYDLKDKIVLVGTTADGIKDEFFTPNGLEYGVFVHANILNTILGKHFLTYFDKKGEWLLLFLLVITSVYFNLSHSRKVLILSNLFLAGFFLLLLPVTIFLFTNLIMNYPIEMIFGLILSQTLSNGVKYLIEDKNKEKLKKSLSEYVGADIAEEVLEEEGKVNFDGEEKQAILFFSDIEGFTTISEKLVPRRLVAFLREYLSEMSHIILDERGYINKYEGDAIMALWGVFSKLRSENYESACRVSLKQISLLQALNKDWLKHYGSEIHIRIGLHAGDVIVGNIGAQGRKMEFTAL